MIVREAQIEDIPQIQMVRNSVKENMLSDPALVTDKDVEDYIINRGKGWVSELDSVITGFAIVSVTDNNVWALFMNPDYEAKGVGKKLHDEMMNWYFSQTDKTIWLSTSPGTRADTFYRKAGWKEIGVYGKGETKFEMTIDDWNSRG
ncbi:GNAT family N-acetyltransferase [Chitinophagaceae bacterium IBVUCB2]|nr:GNAT family N-acetyltransferase [Chitinophagaceae bacterium IBVUCB2]